MEVSKILYCPLPFFFPDQFYVDEITIALFPLGANAMRVTPFKKVRRLSGDNISVTLYETLSSPYHKMQKSLIVSH